MPAQLRALQQHASPISAQSALRAFSRIFQQPQFFLSLCLRLAANPTEDRNNHSAPTATIVREHFENRRLRRSNIRRGTTWLPHDLPLKPECQRQKSGVAGNKYHNLTRVIHIPAHLNGGQYS